MERTAAVDLVRGLVAIPSLSRNESAASTWLVARMTALGFDRSFVDEAGNAVGEYGPSQAARVVVLLGHIDTVPGDIPVRIENDESGTELLYGRGSVDAKGPLATFVAAAARLGSRWAHDADLRLVVVGAVEEEAATSKGARFIADQFDGQRNPRPSACVIGEPSRWHRLTLGYKGRLLLDLRARQPMAHSAGPDVGLAATIVELWNGVVAHAATANRDRPRAVDQLSPSLRRFVTTTDAAMDDTVDAQIAWRLPPGVDAEAVVTALLGWTAAHLQIEPRSVNASATLEGTAVTIAGARTTIELQFRGWEKPWRADKQNALVRSFLDAIRTTEPSATPGFVLKTGTSDMNVVAPIWQCPILAYGPGDSALDHTPNEHLPLDEYWRAVLVVERALRNLASSPTPPR